MKNINYWNIHNLGQLPRAKHMVMVIRHSERHEIVNEEDVSLTSQGLRMANDYGKTLSENFEITGMLSSRRTRCIQTANQILSGAGKDQMVDVLVSDKIYIDTPQPPAPYTLAFMDKLYSKKIAKGMAEFYFKDRNYWDHFFIDTMMFAGCNEKSIGIVVAHDVTINLMYRMFFRDTDVFAGNPTQYLDGILLIQENNRLRIVMPEQEIAYPFKWNLFVDRIVRKK